MNKNYNYPIILLYTDNFVVIKNPDNFDVHRSQRYNIPNMEGYPVRGAVGVDLFQNILLTFANPANNMPTDKGN